MSTLESIVPPLDLCLKIPQGQFADSALVWWGACVYPRLYPDGVRFNTLWHKKGTTPSPTLQEILVELKDEEAFVLFGKHKNDRKWHAYCNHPDGYVDSRIPAEDRDNPATASLKLWLELNGKENTKNEN